jgi:hypothetical protein
VAFLPLASSRGVCLPGPPQHGPARSSCSPRQPAPHGAYLPLVIPGRSVHRRECPATQMPVGMQIGTYCALPPFNGTHEAATDSHRGSCPGGSIRRVPFGIVCHYIAHWWGLKRRRQAVQNGDQISVRSRQVMPPWSVIPSGTRRESELSTPLERPWKRPILHTYAERQ